MSTEDWRSGGFGIYVHWPFCAAKCPYCDFNSHVRQAVDQKRWQAALTSELKRSAALTPGRTVDTVFFGGGTPSLMTPDTVDGVLNAIRSEWTLSDTAEITMEANPTSVEAGRFSAYADAGVNRLSMGIQSLHDADLKALGRMHSAAEARAAFDIARNHFDRVSFDLIYARQNQTADAWEREMREARAMAVDHLSLYQLTIEQGTRFGEMHANGRLRGLPNDDLAADMYLKTQDIADDLGLPAYEISNHAVAGAESRHNLIYWRYGDYVGVGPGAHGRLTLANGRHATETVRHPETWLERVEAEGSGEEKPVAISGAEQATEYLMMSLRLREGTDPARFEALGGYPMAEKEIAALVEDGFLHQSQGRLAATRKGRPVLNAILGRLLA